MPSIRSGLARFVAALVLLLGSTGRIHGQEIGTVGSARAEATRLLDSTGVAEGDGRDSPGSAVTVGFAYVGDAFQNVSGGSRRDGALLHDVDLTIGVDGDAAFGLRGFEASMYLLGNFGGSVTELAGDRQGASNIEAPSAVRLFELWVQQSWREQLSLRLGLYDLNSEFYALDAAAVFLNSSHGIGPEFAASGVTGPSIFPVTSLTARLRWAPTPGRYAMLAVLDGVPGSPGNEKRFVNLDIAGREGVLTTAEIGLAGTEGGRKLAVGGWTYTAEFPDAVETEVTRDGARGAYLLAETRLLGSSDAPGRGLAGFARLGYADAAVHAVQWSWGGGLVYSGMFSPGEDDDLGLALTSAAHSSRYLRGQERAGLPFDRTETSVELTYSRSVTPWLRIQPDVQYILNPGMDPRLADSLLLGARVEVAF